MVSSSNDSGSSSTLPGPIRSPAIEGRNSRGPAFREGPGRGNRMRFEEHALSVMGGLAADHTGRAADIERLLRESELMRREAAEDEFDGGMDRPDHLLGEHS